VLKLPLLVGLQEKGGELIIPVTSCPTIIILEKNFKFVYAKNVAFVTLITDTAFLLPNARTFGCREFYEGGPRVRRPPVKWSAIAKSLKSTGLKDDGETAQQHTEVFIYFRSLNC
jgi:hypothetical protein